jgi:hypothetical protein
MPNGEAGATILFAPDPSVQVDEIDLGTLAGSVLAFGRGVILHGYSVLETTGAAGAKLRIRDGASVAGSVVARIGLAAGASDKLLTSDLGVRITSGLFVELVSGSVEVTLYVRLPGGEV